MEVKKHDTYFDADGLRQELSALARAQADKTKLRAEALALIKTRFHDARAQVRSDVEAGALAGLAAARALSAIQDALIQVLYDFATKLSAV